MVTIKNDIGLPGRRSRGGKMVLLAVVPTFVPAFATAVASAFVPMEADLVLPVLGFMIMSVFFGLVVLWWQAETERVALAAQPADRKQDARTGAGALVLRPPVSAGPAGVLRELAKAAGELGAVAGTGRAGSAKPVLALVPESRTDRFPEPSLLPSMCRSSAAEAGLTRLVIQAFDADRIELHLQPVVSLPKGQIRFYEALGRLRLADGTLLSPSEFLPVVERSGQASEFDRRVLIRSMEIARHLVARGSEAIVSVNLSPHSIAETGFLRSLASLLDASPEILGKIVLEMPQHSSRQLDPAQLAALADLRERGIPFSLDCAADLGFEARALADLGIRFMKLPADLLIAAAEQVDGRYAGPETDVRDFASSLRRQGILLIAERVELEAMVPVLCDLGIPLAQGFTFAAPRPVRPEIAGGETVHSFGQEDGLTRLRQAG